MAKDRTREQAAMVTARYGKTTGASTGTKKPPAPKVKVRPKGRGISAKITARF